MSVIRITPAMVTRTIRKREPAHMPAPVIVLHSVVRSPFLPSVGWEWQVVSDPCMKKGCVLNVERQTALGLIKVLGLTEAHRSKDGTVYDTPSRDFHRTYQGLSSIVPD